MSNKQFKKGRFMKILTIIGVVFIVVFAFSFYMSIKTKSTDISKHQPFQQYVNQTVTLQQEAVLYKELKPFNNNYPYTIIDDMHPLWEYYQRLSISDQKELTKIKTFPAGTKINFQKAVNYANGVSGNSTPLIFGVILDGAKKHKVGYQWGEKSAMRFFDGVKKCWFFHQAVWQQQKDTSFYALPVAKWW